MNRYAWWQYVLIIVLIALGIIYALPNLYGSNPAIQIARTNSALLSDTDQASIKESLKEQKLPYISIKGDKNSILIRFDDIAHQLQAVDFLKASLKSSQYIVSPNIAANTPSWLRDFGAKQLTKGLDLQGGIHFLEEVDTSALIKKHLKDDSNAIAGQLREQKIRYTGVNVYRNNAIQIHFLNDAAKSDALDYLRRNYANYDWVTSKASSKIAVLGTMTQQAYGTLVSSAVSQNMSILRSRVNELGVSEPVVVQQGLNQISVDLPGIQDTARAQDIIGKVATVSWHMVDDDNNPITAKQTGDVPFGDTLYSDEDGNPILIKNQVVLQGSAITSANAQIGESGLPEVAVTVGGSAQSMFNRITAKNNQKRMAVIMTTTQLNRKVVKGKVQTTSKQVSRVINASRINSATGLGNRFVITGLPSQTYAKNLALYLRSGAYSAPLVVVSSRIVGPTLGKENIAKGELSTLVGLCLVIVFMALYYRLFGFFASIALVLNLIFIIAILSFIGATITLAGIAAIVLTLGMAVDANVLINERIREELRNGMTAQAAIHAGYSRAFMTIVDANVTTLIVAIVLVTISSSSVKGFAVNLIIGLLTSMITAIFFTRAAVNLTYGGRLVKKLSIGV